MLTQSAATQPESFSESSNSSTAIALKANQLLSTQALNTLNVRSNLKGGLQLAGHLAVMGVSGYLWATQSDSLFIALPALILYGVSLAAMFAPMHECCHRTAFANNRLNDGVAWFAGLLSFYNSAFYRRYHKWHHRYTQIPEKDPELSDRKPQTLAEYLVVISGFNWWIGKIRGHLRIAFGSLEGCPYISDTVRSEVIRSTRLQLLVYGVAIALSIAYQHPWFLLYWVLPLAVGQPVLRAFLLAEHTGCTHDDNALTNTRTTLTIAPFRWLMWNMPFHAEHHLYASIPFHALPAAHKVLQSHFSHVDQGYVKVNRSIIAQLGSHL
ncbi:fatty acid desaturase family protein [Leptolyngbyaceae cyanobacterium UHCC 1019]